MTVIENDIANVNSYDELEGLIKLHFPELDSRNDNGHFWVSAGTEWIRIELRSDGNHKVFVPNLHTQSAPVGAGKILSSVQLGAELQRLSNLRKGMKA